MFKKKLYLIKRRWITLSLSIKKRIIIIFTLLVLYNIVIWSLGFILSFNYPFLLGLLAIAYGLGLRHAVDADHIAAIDNTTRKFMLAGEKPISIGLFFSLGHSTIVILLSLAIAITSSAIAHYFSSLQSAGVLIGTSISSLFLFLIGSINLIAFFQILHSYRHAHHQKHKHVHVFGPLAKLFKPLFQTVNKPWHMYFIGLLFGLGFDTASEIGLLSISASTSMSHTLLWAIILLPLAFTAGMTLLDTIDGILMLNAYGWAYIRPERKLYYNMCITLLSVLVAFVIGGTQLLNLFTAQTGINLSIFANDNLGIVIVSTFVFLWILFFGIYKLRKT
jgi:high-affinity nickel-transport protein